MARPAGAGGAGGADAVEDAAWSARRDAGTGYGVAVFDVNPGAEAGAQTSITVRYYHAVDADPGAGPGDGGPADDYALFDTFTLVRPRSDGRRWHPREPARVEPRVTPGRRRGGGSCTVESMAAADIVVVGAGVVGLSTAISLAEAGLSTRVVAAEPPSRVTSVAAGAIWGPVRCGPADRCREWARTGLEVLAALADEPSAGVHQLHGREVARAVESPPPWTSLLADLRVLAAPSCRPGSRPAGPTPRPRSACRSTWSTCSTGTRGLGGSVEYAHGARRSRRWTRRSW